MRIIEPELGHRNDADRLYLLDRLGLVSADALVTSGWHRPS
jgi:hypothetical protein